MLNEVIEYEVKYHRDPFLFTLYGRNDKGQYNDLS